MALGQRWLLFVTSVAIFMIGTAVSVGLVRYGPASFWWGGHYGIIPRYRIYSSFFWVALLCAYIPLSARHLRPRQGRTVTALITIIVLLMLLPSQWNDFIRDGKRKNNFEEAALAYATGFSKEAFRAGFARPPSQVPEIYRYLKQNRLNLFNLPWTRWTGTLLNGVNTTTKTVVGELTTADRLKSGWRIQGWSATPHQGKVIVGIDEHGRIRAIARLTQTPAGDHPHLKPFQAGWLRLLYSLEPELPAILDRGRGWYGYAQHVGNPHDLSYFLTRPDKQVIARLVPPSDSS